MLASPAPFVVIGFSTASGGSVSERSAHDSASGESIEPPARSLAASRSTSAGEYGSSMRNAEVRPIEAGARYIAFGQDSRQDASPIEGTNGRVRVNYNEVK